MGTLPPVRSLLILLRGFRGPISTVLVRVINTKREALNPSSKFP